MNRTTSENQNNCRTLLWATFDLHENNVTLAGRAVVQGKWVQRATFQMCTRAQLPKAFAVFKSPGPVVTMSLAGASIINSCVCVIPDLAVANQMDRFKASRNRCVCCTIADRWQHDGRYSETLSQV